MVVGFDVWGIGMSSTLSVDREATNGLSAGSRAISILRVMDAHIRVVAAATAQPLEVGGSLDLVKVVPVNVDMLDDQEQRVVHQVMLFQEYGVHLANPIKPLELLLGETHGLIILAYLEEVEVFQDLLLTAGLPPELWFHLSLSVDVATLEVEGHDLVLLVGQMSSVLHDNNVKWTEVVSLDGKHAIDPREQRLVLGIFDVLDIVIEDVEHSYLLIASERLDQEPVVM